VTEPLPYASVGEAPPLVPVRSPGVMHVLGVAFPYTDVDGSRAAAMEGSFLRLAYAVTRLQLNGARAVGYFVVLRQELRDAARRLQARYEVTDAVHIVFASLLISDMTRLSEAGEVAAKERDPSALVAVARGIGGDALRREITTREPAAVEHASSEGGPFGVQWDYYGVVREGLDARAGKESMAPRLF
jgi:hypothetical protein